MSLNPSCVWSQGRSRASKSLTWESSCPCFCQPEKQIVRACLLLEDYGLLFCCCDIKPWPGKLIEGVYLDFTVQRKQSITIMLGGGWVGRTVTWVLPSWTTNMSGMEQWGWCEAVKLQSSIPPVTYFLKQGHTSYDPSIQEEEEAGGLWVQAQHAYRMICKPVPQFADPSTGFEEPPSSVQ